MATAYTSNLGFANPDQWDCFWDDDWYRNQDIKDVVLNCLLSTNRVIIGLIATDGGGLTVNLSAGTGVVNRVATLFDADTLTMTAAGAEDVFITNWIYVASTGVLTVSTTPPVGEYLCLAVVDCDQSDILRIYDIRPMWIDPDAYDQIDRIISGTNVVDVFIYDTSKDSDGGAWVDSALTQSWYGEELNTLTRGKTRRFPRIALIVAEKTAITIYDLTDPAVPMWLVALRNTNGWSWMSYLESSAATSVSMLNGVLTIGSGGTVTTRSGLCIANFIDDSAVMVRGGSEYSQDLKTIGERNNTLPVTGAANDLYIANYYVNDVALVALDNVPFELITNGAFDADIDWTKGDGWSISGGLASCDGSQTGNAYLSQAGRLIIGQEYEITYTLSGRTAGSIRPLISASGTGTWVAVDGTYTETITAVDNDTVYFQGDVDFTGSVDNVSVTPVNYDREFPGYPGLIIPTIAVATDGGVSIIHGPAGMDTCVDIINAGKVGFVLVDEGLLYSARETETDDLVEFGNIPIIDYASSGTWRNGYYSGTTTGAYSPNLALLGPGVASTTGRTAISKNTYGAAEGLSIIDEDTTDPSAGMVAYITDAYLSGWQPGDIKGCFLASGVAETVGVDITTEQITGGDFGGDGEYGWTLTGNWSIANGYAESTSGSQGIVSTSVDIDNDTMYRFSVSISDYSLGTLRVSAYADGNYNVSSDITSDGIHVQNIETTNTSVTFSNTLFLQNILSSAVAKADDFYLWQAGDEKVQTGIIDDEYGWSTTGDWSISGGAASHTAGSTVDWLYQPVTTIGQEYRISISTIGITGGIINGFFGGTTVFSGISSDGIYTETKEATTDSNVSFNTSATSSLVGSLDDVYVWQAGSELVVDGVIDDEYAWNNGGGSGSFAIGSGVITFSGSPYADNGFSYTKDIAYRIQSSVLSIDSGQFMYGFGGFWGEFFGDSPGIYTETSIPSISTPFRLAGSSAINGVIDDVYVWLAGSEELGTWVVQGGGTFSESDGVITVDSTDPSDGIKQAPYVTTGGIFELAFNLDMGTSTSVNVAIYSDLGTPLVSTNITTSGDHAFTFESVDGRVTVYLVHNDGGTTTYWTGVSLRQITDLIENGEFSTDRTWTKGTGWTISGGQAICDGTQGANSNLYQTCDISNSSQYIVQVDVAAISGTCTVLIISEDSYDSYNLSAGVNSFRMSPDTSIASYNETVILQASSGATITVNSIKVYEAEFVDGTWQPVGNLVTNPCFEGYYDDTVWSDDSSGTGSVELVAGNIVLTRGADSSNKGKISQIISTTIGKVYEVIVNVNETDSTGGGQFYVGGVIQSYFESDETLTFKATVANTTIELHSGTNDTSVYIESISIREITDIVENGEFSYDRAWTDNNATHVISAGEITVTQTASYGLTRQLFTTEIGKTYIIQGELKCGTAQSVRLKARALSGGVLEGQTGDFTTTSYEVAKFRFTATTVQTYVELFIQDTDVGDTGVFKNIKVYEAEKVGGTWQPVGNLVVNPSFEGYVNSAKWTDGNAYSDVYTFAGNLRVENIDGSASYAHAKQSVYIDPADAGIYEVSVNAISPAHAWYLQLSGNVPATISGPQGTESSKLMTFEATGGTITFDIVHRADSAGEYVDFNDITIRKITDVIDNGEFSMNRAWTVTGSWTIASGTATHTGTNFDTIAQSALQTGVDYIAMVHGYASGGSFFVYEGTLGQYHSISNFDGIETWHFVAAGPTLTIGSALDGVEIYDIKIYEAELVNGTWQPVGNLVVNPSFEGFLNDAWLTDGSTSATLPVVNQGTLELYRAGSAEIEVADISFATEIDQLYEINIDLIAGSNNCRFKARQQQSTSDIFLATLTTAKTYTFTFRAYTTTTWLRMYCDIDGGTSWVDNVSVKKSQNLLINGNFGNGLSWGKYGTSAEYDQVYISGGQLVYASAVSVGMSQSRTFVEGGTYKVIIDVDSITSGSAGFQLGDDADTLTEIFAGVNENIVTFEGSAGSTFYIGYLGGAVQMVVNSVELYLLEEPDRSYNRNDFQIIGTLDKTAVATGADLVEYSGFSTVDYMEQPYNSDYDFGTGEFYLGFWAYRIPGATGAEYWFERMVEGDASSYLYIRTDNVAGQITASLTGSVVVQAAAALPEGTRALIFLTRRAGYLRLYINDTFITEVASTGSLTIANAITRIGKRAYDGTQPASNTALSLFRIGAGSPTDEQIAKIYDTERLLFQANSKCLLSAGPDVTALSYDPDSLTYTVANNDGSAFAVDLFQGLRRIGQKTYTSSVIATSHNTDTAIAGESSRVTITNPAT